MAIYIGIVGLNAAGKSHLATRLAADLGINRVSGDDLRHFIRENITYFMDTDFSYPNPKSTALNPLVDSYRIALCSTLLAAGENVINDGSGANREFRSKHLAQFKEQFPELTIVLIWAKISEDELLERLANRDAGSDRSRWTDTYHDIRKQSFEPPHDDEAEVVIEYDQHNYEEIKQKIVGLLA